MQTQAVPLHRERNECMYGDIHLVWYTYGNWPWVGGREHEWAEGHKCSCGNQRFLFTYRVVERPPDEDAPPDTEPVRKPEYRIVCGKCIDFYKNEVIYGELDYSTMTAYVYDMPKPASGRDGDVSDGFGGYVPPGVETNFDVEWFDNSRYTTNYDTGEGEPILWMFDRRKPAGRKGKHRAHWKPAGPALAGLEMGDGDGDTGDRRRRDPGDERIPVRAKRAAK